MKTTMNAARTMAAALFLLAGLTACEEPGLTPPADLPEVPLEEVLTEDARLRLESGQFPEMHSRNQKPRITRSRARVLAVALVRQYDTFVREHLEEVHGQPIDFAALTADQRVLLAESPFVQKPPDHPLRALTTDYYLVTLRQGSVRTMIVAVSTGLDAEITGSGMVRIPSGFGDAWWPTAVPAAMDDGTYPSPERAALIAASAAGSTKVAGVPRLVRHPSGTPVTAFYEVPLNREVRVAEASGSVRRVDRLYVGPDAQVRAATTDAREGGAVRKLGPWRAMIGGWAFDRLSRPVEAHRN